MHKDTYYNLLLQSDYKTISRLCSTNKEINSICNQNSFWVDKMNYDQLPIYTTVLNYKSYYFKISKLIDKVNNIFNLPYTTVLTIQLDYENQDLLSLLDFDIEFNETIYSQSIHIIGEYGEYYFYYSINNQSVVDKKLPVNEIKDIIVKLLYYYPNNIQIWID